MPVGSRRDFLSAVGLGLLTALPPYRPTAQDSLPAGRLYDPTKAGRSREPSTAADNLEAVKVIEQRLKCTCGCTLDIYTCRTTDFTCTYSPAMHRQVLALMNQGLTAEQILAEFVAEHGEQILMAPPKQGFNLAGYFVPGLAVLAAGALLVLAMRRWTRRAVSVAAAAAAEPTSSAASPEALAELERELKELEA